MNTDPAPVSKAALWSGRVMSALPALMLVFSAIMKFNLPPDADKGFNHLGVSVGLAPALGVLELVCTLLYLVPRTAVLGAILLTGYLGGAIMTHLRVGDPYYTQPILGVLLWGGLWLRDLRVRALIPLRK
jgi:uncharacterized membrane protein YphA (DoxX/SURF4 family)